MIVECAICENEFETVSLHRKSCSSKCSEEYRLVSQHVRNEEYRQTKKYKDYQRKYQSGYSPKREDLE